MIEKHKLAFDGGILKRGFWFYVWKVTEKETKVVYYYVGRTGDSSSLNAASPFSRLSSHLSRNQRGNALLRHLRENGVDDTKCNFEFFAFGLLFSEEMDWASHKKTRDQAATIEKLVAEGLKEKGFQVFGVHQISEKRFVHAKELERTAREIIEDILGN